MSAVTSSQAAVLGYAFQFFNDRLFGGCLPDALVILHRHPQAKGYFQPVAHRARCEDAASPFLCEIALNPDLFSMRSDRQIFSTLAHEMVHLWQDVWGGNKKGHHNQEWGEKMEQIGLIPSNTGEPGGKKTGRRVSHYIEVGGPFDLACDELLRYVHFQYEAVPPVPKVKRETVQRVKMVCPACPDVEVRAIAGTPVRCGRCDELLEEQSKD